MKIAAGSPEDSPSFFNTHQPGRASGTHTHTLTHTRTRRHACVGSGGERGEPEELLLEG